MYQTQKRLIGIMGLVFLGIFIHVSTLTTLTRNASADYTVTAGQKCDDGKDPTVVPGATPTYNCTGDRSTAQQTNPGGTQVGGAPTATNDNETTCAIEKMGWILCPIIETSGKVSDQAFQYLSKTFLETEPELVSNSNAGTKQAWELARNLANIMFIIAFLVIIYSQVTGAGITNYGIKKMLPRLIVAAIAVNASYYICQILVDLTNIMGYEIQKFLVDTARSITSNAVMPIATDGPSLSQDSGTLSQIAIGVLAVGAIVYFLLPVLGSVVLFVLITCLSIIIILLLRKTFIVLLIVAAPVAFVLYLLPNTEKYFQKWLSMFWKLLLVFPVVGILMGGGQLASSIILVAGTQSTNYKDTGKKCITLPQYSGSTQSQTNRWGWFSNPQSNQATVTGGAAIGTCTAGSVPFMLGLTAAGIAVLPLLAVWSVLKGALAATGAIGGKLATTINGMNSGAKGRLQKARQENSDYRRNRRDALAMKGSAFTNPINVATLGGARRGAQRRAKHKYAKDELNRTEVDYISDKATSTDKDGNPVASRFGKRLAGGVFRNQESENRVVSNALNAQNQLNIENVKAEHAIIDQMPVDQITAALDAGADRNSARTAAMLERVIQLKGPAGAEKYINHYGSQGTSVSSKAIAGSLSNQSYLGASDIANLENGQLGQSGVASNFQTMAATGMQNYTPEMYANASNKEKTYAQNIATRNTAVNIHINGPGGVIDVAKTIDSLRGKLS